MMYVSRVHCLLICLAPITQQSVRPTGNPWPLDDLHLYGCEMRGAAGGSVVLYWPKSLVLSVDVRSLGNIVNGYQRDDVETRNNHERLCCKRP